MVNSRRAKSWKKRLPPSDWGGPSALKGDFQNPILLLFRIRGRPNEHKLIDDLTDWGRLASWDALGLLADRAGSSERDRRDHVLVRPYVDENLGCVCPIRTPQEAYRSR
jgi:hypothetical protein